MRKRKARKYKKYSYLDRVKYYEKIKEQENVKGGSAKMYNYADGYLYGLRGVKISRDEPESAKSGNEAGLRFWGKMIQKKI